MSYLLDTCVISDISKRADAGLLEWASEQDPLDLYLSDLSLGEIQKGIALLPPDHARRQELEQWLRNDLPRQFGERLLPVMRTVALAYSEMAAAGQLTGRPLPVLDGLLLATAQVHGLAFVTRNTRDVEDRGVPVVNPYSGRRP